MLPKISVNQVDDVWFATQSIRYVECLHLMVVFLVVVVVVVLVCKVWPAVEKATRCGCN